LGEVRAIFEQARRQEKQSLFDKLGYWPWRHSEAVEGVNPSGARGLQIAGRWREAAQAWRQTGCPLEEGQALLQGDRPGRQQAEKIFQKLGAGAYLARARSIDEPVRGL
jgi:hypothetical protein